jgi:hypothetical protein
MRHSEGMSAKPRGRPRNSLQGLVSSGKWSWRNARHRRLLQSEDLPKGADKRLREIQAWYRIQSRNGWAVDAAQLFEKRLRELR